ncbi:MAG: AsmA family protein, partial [Pseudomonadota bacterium]
MLSRSFPMVVFALHEQIAFAPADGRGGGGTPPQDPRLDPRVRQAMAQQARAQQLEAQRAQAQSMQVQRTQTMQPGQLNPGDRIGGYSGPGKPRRSGGFSIFKLLGYVVMILVVLIGAGVAYLIVAPPTGLIREQMISQVKAQTGRTLQIAGQPQISFWPSIGLSMDGVALGPPPGMSAPDTVRVENLTVTLKLLPLLSREVEVDRLILTRPVFDLRKTANGQTSWTFAKAAAVQRPVRYARALQLAQAGAGDLPPEAREFLANATPRQSSSGGGTSALKNLTLADARIVDGVLNYTDETTGTAEVVEKINVNLGLEQIDSPLRIDGTADWKRETIALDGQLTSLEQVLGKKPAQLRLTMASEKLSGGFNGRVTVADRLSALGAVSADSRSLRQLAGWLGATLPSSAGYGPMNLKGRMQVDGPRIKVSQLTANLDDMTATGDVVVETSGARPAVTADLSLTRLNLNNYLPADGGTQTGPGGSRVKGATFQNGWSAQPVDLGGLMAVDANTKITVGPVTFKKLKADRMRINAALKDGSLNAQLSEMALYGGSGQGTLRVTAAQLAGGRAAGGRIGANFNFNRISARPLLRDALDFDRIDGRGQLQLVLNTQGESEAQWINALTGSSRFVFNDGAIAGVNFAKYLRAISTGQIANLATAGDEKTDFSELSATLDIRNGVASNSDLKLLSPLLRVTGDGRLSLPTRQIDYTVRPRLVSSIEGQGARGSRGGLEVPIRVTGPVDRPRYTPDLSGILKDPGRALDTVREIGKQFKGK